MEKLEAFIKENPNYFAETTSDHNPPASDVPIITIRVIGRLIPWSRLRELIILVDSIKTYQIDVSVEWKNGRRF